MKVSEEIVKTHIQALIENLEKLENWNEEVLKDIIITYNKENGLKN